MVLLLLGVHCSERLARSGVDGVERDISAERLVRAIRGWVTERASLCSGERLTSEDGAEFAVVADESESIEVLRSESVDERPESEESPALRV